MALLYTVKDASSSRIEDFHVNGAILAKVVPGRDPIVPVNAMNKMKTILSLNIIYV